MPALRRQLPAYSPLALSTVAAALAGVVHEPDALRSEVVSRLCAIYGASDAVLVDSGTSALQLAMAGVRATIANGAVALPAYCCYDVATAATGADTDVQLYDLDPVTLGPDDTSIRRAMQRRPAAVVAAHLFGYPVDVHRLDALCRDSGVVLIEDAAQSAGGILRGKSLGSFGSLTVLSFGRGKGITAGSGGALLAHDELGARVVSWATAMVTIRRRGLREALALAVQWGLGRPDVYWLPAAIPFLHLGETVYRAPHTPSALSSAAAAAVQPALRAADGESERRRRVADRLVACAKAGTKVRVVEPIDGAMPGYLRLPVRTRRSGVTEAVRLLGRYGAAPAYPAPLHTLRGFGGRVKNATDAFPGATELAETLITLPTHGLVAETDVAAVEAWLW